MRTCGVRAADLVAFVTAAILAGAGVSSAQESVAEPSPTLTGVVLDDATGLPVAGALVAIVDHYPATLSDSLGRFTLSGFARGPQTLNVRQLGYLEISTEILPPELPDVLVEIPLAPAPIRLEGVSVAVDGLRTMTRRIESRRRSMTISSFAYDRERLVRSGMPTMYDFLMVQPAVYPTPCYPGMCMLRRGRPVRPRVYIDELPAWGGFDDLEIYRPQDFYLVEVFGGGTEIHAYTYDFMERVAERPVALLPIWPWR